MSSSRRSDARRTMVATAAAQLAQRGPEGMSFSTVLDESKAPRGSIYHHFPHGKGELIGEALVLVGQRVDGGLRSLVGLPAAVVSQFFFAGWRAVLDGSDCRSGCAIAAVAVSNPTDDRLSESVREVFTTWSTTLTAALEAGGVAPDAAPALATTMLAAVEGALILSRGQHSITAFDTVATTMQHLVESLAPA